ncbi:MAG TPA: hypothetical protein VFA89_03430 [Terriglobales bacterium]|nr:hypothetical protein [Terriglobales bacterium]
MRTRALARVCLVVVAALIVLTLPARAQSCALCYTQAASAGARMIQALKSGILILIVPPTLASVGLIGVLYHKRNQFADSEQQLADRKW